MLNKEMYLGDRYRVVFSAEEFAEFEAAGWSPRPEPGKKYRPYTAVDEEPAQAEEAPADPPKAEEAPAQEAADSDAKNGAKSKAKKS